MKTSKVKVICAMALGLFSLEILSQPAKIRIGVLDLSANNVSQADANTLTGLLRGELVRHGAFDVLDRNNMNAILKEQEFQQTGCTEQACAVRIGQLLNMQSMVYGTLARLGESYVITVDLIDIQSGRITQSAKEKFAKLDNADDALTRIVNMLASTKKQESSYAGGLIAHYPLAGDVKDHSGNGFHAEMPGGRFNPAPARGRKGLPGTAYEFNGLTNDSGGHYLEVSASKARQALKPVRAITVALWAHAEDWGRCSTSGSGTPQDRSLISTAEGGGWAIYCNRNNRIGFSVYVEGKYREPLINAARMESGWHHLAGTYDSATGAALFYLDGKPLSSTEGNPAPMDYSRYPNTTMIIGADAEEGGGPEVMQGGNTHFAGRISEVRIYNRAVTEAEISALAGK